MYWFTGSSALYFRIIFYIGCKKKIKKNTNRTHALIIFESRYQINIWIFRFPIINICSFSLKRILKFPYAWSNLWCLKGEVCSIYIVCVAIFFGPKKIWAVGFRLFEKGMGNGRRKSGRAGGPQWSVCHTVKPHAHYSLLYPFLSPELLLNAIILQNILI